MSTPELEQVTPNPETPEQRYEWQPRDKQGRALGGKQVVIYRTNEEFREKVLAQNEELIRKLREVTRNHRLGINDEAVPDSAERMTGVIDFKERQLTSEQRFELSQKLNDPEHFTEARDILLESAIGIPPAQLRAFLSKQQLFEIQQRAVDNYVSFVQSDRSYYDCPDNRETMTDWMFKKGLSPTVDNFILASSTLRDAGLLLGAPEQQQVSSTPTEVAVEAEAQSQPPAAVAPRIRDEQPPQQTRQSRVPSGLNERTSSASGSTPTSVSAVTNADGSSLTLRDINRMPPEDLRRRLNDPNFVALVEKLESESKQRKNALGLGKF